MSSSSSSSSSSRYVAPIGNAINNNNNNRNNNKNKNNNNHGADIESNGVADSELDDYFYALFVQALLISDDREIGVFGKLSPDSDTQVAIEHMLQEAQEMELSYRLAKSLSSCETLPDILLEELELQDDITCSDRELALRVERGDPSAERLLSASTARFPLVRQHFNTTADCCACTDSKRVYNAPCAHGYCEECARALYSHALTNRAFIPVRCCRLPFASALVEACLMDDEDVTKYQSIKHEIEHPCPPTAELDAAASRVISEKGWKVCGRCGAVVERVSGCVHITCMCGHEFCYTCQKPWRTCLCELYPVEELNAILNERVGNGDPGNARHRLQNVLRNYYQHDHHWERRAAHGQACGVCGWGMPSYSMHCEGCMETRCHRCSFNN